MTNVKEVRSLGTSSQGPSSNEKTFTINALFESAASGKRCYARTLIDSGATGNFISKRMIENEGLHTQRLEEPIPVYNTDGTANRGGFIECQTNCLLEIQSHRENIWLEVVEMGQQQDIILGIPWLRVHDPVIKWRQNSIDFQNCFPHHDMFAGVAPKNEERTPLEQLSVIRATQTDHARKTTVREDMETFIPEKFWEYYDIFDKQSFDSLPSRSTFDHAIKLDDNFIPQHGHIHPLSAKEQIELDRFIEENLSTGRIRRSKSPQAAPFFFRNKVEEVNAPGQDPGLRPIQDYRYLNAHTTPDRYPLPLLSEILQAPKFKTAKFFTCLDIRWGFNNIRIKKGDEWKAAFITNRGLFEPLVMLFGMRNAPSSFQRMIDDLFADVLRTGNVFIYVDDIIILGDTIEELDRFTKQVLDIMRSHGLSCKPVKCQFEQEQVKFLGTMLTAGKIAVNPAKVEAIRNWPKPNKVKDIQKFLGTCNFWRKFIEGFSTIARPLNLLLQRGNPFVWTDTCQRSFDELKAMITQAPVLKIPDRSQPFLLETDASGFALGAILSQSHDGHQHPIGFYSATMTPPQCNYATHDQEMLAIISALENWRDLLEGTSEPITIRTDNLALKYFATSRHLSR